MIRAKLKEKFGKNDTADSNTTTDSNQELSTDSIPDETSEEMQQEDEDEGISVCFDDLHCLNFLLD